MVEVKLETNAQELRSKVTPLYHHFLIRSACQPAYLEIYPSRGSFTADYSADVGNSMPYYVWLNHAYRLPISPNLRGYALAEMLENDYVLGLVKVVASQHWIEHDGRNMRGYLTPLGVEALETLDNYLSNYPHLETDYVYFDHDNREIC